MSATVFGDSPILKSLLEAMPCLPNQHNQQQKNKDSKEGRLPSSKVVISLSSNVLSDQSYQTAYMHLQHPMEQQQQQVTPVNNLYGFQPQQEIYQQQLQHQQQQVTPVYQQHVFAPQQQIPPQLNLSDCVQMSVGCSATNLGADNYDSSGFGSPPINHQAGPAAYWSPNPMVDYYQEPINYQNLLQMEQQHMQGIEIFHPECVEQQQ